LCYIVTEYFIYQETRAAFHLTLATLLESFHLCYLSNVKQGQMMLASVASVKWNAATVVSQVSSIYRTIYMSTETLYLYASRRDAST